MRLIQKCRRAQAYINAALNMAREGRSASYFEEPERPIFLIYFKVLEVIHEESILLLNVRRLLDDRHNLSPIFLVVST